MLLTRRQHEGLMMNRRSDNFFNEAVIGKHRGFKF